MVRGLPLAELDSFTTPQRLRDYYHSPLLSNHGELSVTSWPLIFPDASWNLLEFTNRHRKAAMICWGDFLFDAYWNQPWQRTRCVPCQASMYQSMTVRDFCSIHLKVLIRRGLLYVSKTSWCPSTAFQPRDGVASFRLDSPARPIIYAGEFIAMTD